MIEMGILRSDLRRITEDQKWGFICLALFNRSVIALVSFRFCAAWRRSWLEIAFLRAICEKSIEIATGIHLPSGAIIGAGLRIYHGYGLIINSGATIGENCDLYARVTIGERFPGDRCPTIGDRVVIGTGACIFGPVHVPNDVVIAANTVITPANTAWKPRRY